MGQRGFLFDGEVALERPVSVGLGPSALLIGDASGATREVAIGDLVRLDGDADRLRFGHRSLDGWRLILTKPFDPTLLSALPRRRGSLAPSAGPKTIGVLVTLSLAATLAFGLVVFAPETVARHLPLAWERRIGMAFDLPIEATRCDDRPATRALEQIVDRLDPKARNDGFTVELVDLSEANAAALPGGRMVVLNGLFDDIENPDAIAGIVAHEIAHVRRRHVAAAMIRELGLGTVVTLLGGGAIASNAGGLLSLTFTREAEAEADADAIAMLTRAGIDPRPTAAAFESFRKKEGGWPEWLGDHPSNAGRARRFTNSFDPAATYRPVLTEAQSQTLLNACKK